MQKVIVTGGGGFVGKAIVRKLIEKGIETAVVARNCYPDIKKMGGHVFQCDIRDLKGLTEIFKGYDTVFHVAAKAGVWGKREDYFSCNVEGTENVISACQTNNVSHLVYTSTPSVVFRKSSLENIDENAPYADSFLCHYAASKVAAEKRVLTANSHFLKTTALRPHLVWGPGDNHLIPRIIDRGRKGQLRIIGDGSNYVDISYIDNVAEAHMLAAQNLEEQATAAGRAYFISQGEPVNLWNWINELFVRLSIPPVTEKISYQKAYAAGAALEFFYTLFRVQQEPRMTRFLAEQLSKSHWFSIKNAKNDLGYEPTVSNEEGMDRLISWIQAGTDLVIQ